MILIIIIIVGLIGFYAIKQTIENKLLNDKLRVQQRIYENEQENLPEDAVKDGHDQVQKLTDKYVKIVDETESAKEKEVMEI